MNRKKIFFIAPEEDIRKGLVSDVYFSRISEVLKVSGINPFTKGEVRAGSLPDNWSWSVFAGLEEVLHLFEGFPVDVYALEEGEIFYPETPVFRIEGRYLSYAVYETALLGFLCQASGIATMASRCKKAAEGRPVYSFGARRMHPAITPMIERNAFIGGCDGVAAIESAQFIKEEPVGTMSHSFILCFQNEKEAFKAFHRVMPPKIRRIALIDTFQDEKFGALTAAEAIGSDLFAVRLDTPSSRRGNFLKILEEVRWELNLRGFNHVKIFISGGLNEKLISDLNKFADAYGVGTAISNAPVVDFSFDLVEVDNKPLAKRGKTSGAKQVYRCLKCYRDYILPWEAKKPVCGCGSKKLEPLLKLWIKNGKLVKKLPSPQEIREKVLKNLEKLELKL